MSPVEPLHLSTVASAVDVTHVCIFCKAIFQLQLAIMVLKLSQFSTNIYLYFDTVISIKYQIAFQTFPNAIHISK